MNKNILYALSGVAACAAVIGCVVVGNIAYQGMAPAPQNTDGSYADQYRASAECQIHAIKLRGMLTTYIPSSDSADNKQPVEDTTASEDVVAAIKAANIDDSVKGIILDVESSGGYPVAGEEIANALRASEKPTVAVLRQQGLSAAYWAATGAGRIFASPLSDVGSIGVTMSYNDNVEMNKRNGNGFVSLSVGKYKDAGNPDKPLTAEERAIFQRDLDITQNLFVSTVARNRNIPEADVRAIADGSSVMGARALELRLIDEIGGIPEAAKYLSEKTGADGEVCW